MLSINSYIVNQKFFVKVLMENIELVMINS